VLQEQLTSVGIGTAASEAGVANANLSADRFERLSDSDITVNQAQQGYAQIGQ